MTENGNGANRILSLDQAASQRNAKDDQGRTLRHNATVLEVHQIAVEEGNKVAAWHMQQIPAHVAKMIQDALLDLGLVKVVIGEDNVPLLVAMSDPRPEWVRPVAPPDSDAVPEAALDADSASQDKHSEPESAISKQDSASAEPVAQCTTPAECPHALGDCPDLD